MKNLNKRAEVARSESTRRAQLRVCDSRTLSKAVLITNSNERQKIDEERKIYDERATDLTQRIATERAAQREILHDNNDLCRRLSNLENQLRNARKETDKYHQQNEGALQEAVRERKEDKNLKSKHYQLEKMDIEIKKKTECLNLKNKQDLAKIDAIQKSEQDLRHNLTSRSKDLRQEKKDNLTQKRSFFTALEVADELRKAATIGSNVSRNEVILGELYDSIDGTRGRIEMDVIEKSEKLNRALRPFGAEKCAKQLVSKEKWKSMEEIFKRKFFEGSQKKK